MPSMADRLRTWIDWFRQHPVPTVEDRQRADDARAARAADLSADRIAETLVRQRVWFPEDG
jgi:hypothetical protein